MENYCDFDILELESSILYNKEERDFIFASLFLNDIDTKNKKIFANYINEISKYQVFICNSTKKDFIVDSFKAFYLEKEDLDSIDLFINDDFFLVYKNGIFLYFQKINSSFTKEELKEFVENKLNIKIDNIYEYEKEDIEKLKETYEKHNLTPSFKDFNKTKKNSFYVFILFLLVLFLGIIYYYNLKQNSFDTQNNKTIQTNKDKRVAYQKKFEYKYVSIIINDLLRNLKKLKLKVDKIELTNKEIILDLKTIKKKSIYTFLNQNRKNILSYTIINDTSKKIFKVKINAKIFRR